MKRLLLGSAALVVFAATGSASAWTGFANNPLGPEWIVTFTDNGFSTVRNPVYSTDPGPYDGSDDTYFGVINNSSKAISGFNLSIPASDIGGFDGDGIDEANYLNIPHNAQDTSGYGGPNAFFTNISADLSSLTVNFITPIAVGGTDVFSLEGEVPIVDPLLIPEPSTWAMMLVGFAGLGFAGTRVRQKSAAQAF